MENNQNKNNDSIKISPTFGNHISSSENSNGGGEKVTINPVHTFASDMQNGMGEAPKKVDEKPSFHPEGGKVTISPIHTYEDDIKNTIKDNKISMVKIAMEEAKKKEAEQKVEEELSPTSSKNQKIILVSLVLFIVGTLGIFFSWNYFMAKKSVDMENSLAHKQSIIPYDEEYLVDLDIGSHTRFLEKLDKAKANFYEKDTSIIYLPIEDKLGTSTSLINTERFFYVLQTRTPAPLVRALNTNFMFGLNKIDDQKNPFLILTSDSFNQVYAGMLEWEPAMADDIGDLFFTKEDLIDDPIKEATTTDVKIASTEASTSVATVSTSSQTIATTTSSSTETQVPAEPFKSRYIIANSLQFKDEIFNNRDMRVLRTTSGKMLMYYTFINDRIVLIARDLRTLDEVIKRLATNQFKQ